MRLKNANGLHFFIKRVEWWLEMKEEMYIRREMEETVRRASGMFRVVLLTGARQTGKSTLLRHCAEKGRGVVTLDDPGERTLAQEDPGYFLQRHPAPVLIDEIQYAPELLPYIKMAVDGSEARGQYWLTGSQRFSLMKGVRESLAGRVAILELSGLSWAERRGTVRAGTLAELASGRVAPSGPPARAGEVWEAIWRGGYPELSARRETDVRWFHASYVRTYLERDVRNLLRVEDERAFLAFLRCAAARTAQELNVADMARDTGVAPNTAKAWLSVLEASGVVYLLRAWSRNRIQRAVKRPKLYFEDTGLCCHLTGWPNPETLEAGAMSGAMLETHAVMEVVKAYRNRGLEAPVFHWRDAARREIDLVVEEGGKAHPVEIKKKERPTASDAAAFGCIPGEVRGKGAVVCFSQSRAPLSREVGVLSVGDL